MGRRRVHPKRLKGAVFKYSCSINLDRSPSDCEPVDANASYGFAFGNVNGNTVSRLLQHASVGKLPVGQSQAFLCASGCVGIQINERYRIVARRFTGMQGTCQGRSISVLCCVSGDNGILHAVFIVGESARLCNLLLPCFCSRKRTQWSCAGVSAADLECVEDGLEVSDDGPFNFRLLLISNPAGDELPVWQNTDCTLCASAESASRRVKTARAVNFWLQGLRYSILPPKKFQVQGADAEYTSVDVFGISNLSPCSDRLLMNRLVACVLVRAAAESRHGSKVQEQGICERERR